MPAGKDLVLEIQPGAATNRPGASRFKCSTGRWHRIDVRKEGILEMPPLSFPRTGAVTIESEVDFALERASDGHWIHEPGRAGTFPVPVGAYRITCGKEVIATFHVAPGSRETIRVPRFR